MVHAAQAVSVGEGASPGNGFAGRRLLFVLNEAYFFLSHRLAVARAAQKAGFEVHVAAPVEHVWAPKDFSLQALRDHGFAFHPIPLWRRSVNPFKDLLTFVALWRLFRRLRPDLVHLVTVKPNLYGGLAARLAAIPAVVYAVTGLGHVFSGSGAGLAALRFFLLRLLALAFGHRNARVIFQNPTDRQRFLEAGIVRPEQAALVAGAGVDLGAFRCRPEAPPPVVVVMAARLIWDKGVAEFVEAARLLREGRVAARFVLLGGTHSSNPRAVPPEQLRAWSAEGFVEWWDYREDVPDILADSHIVCLPSRYGEGVPKILLEAAASGRAVVTTDIPGCRDAVIPGVTGLLVEPGDAPALAKALQSLIENAPLRTSMGQAGRRRAETTFDERAVAADTLALYTSVLPEPARA